MPATSEARKSARLLLAGAAVLVAIALAPVAVGLASAVVLYELFAYPYAWLARRMSARLAALLAVLTALGVVVIPLAWLGWHVSKRLPAVLATVNALRTQAQTSSPGVTAQVQAQVASAVSSVGDWLPGILTSVARNAAWAIVNWSIALLGMYYLLGSASRIWPRFARVLPLSADGAETLRTRFRDITQGMVAGTLLSAAIQGAAIGTGFWFAGLPDSLFWGACAAIATLIPVVGNALVSVPAVVFLLVREDYKGVLAIGVFAGLLPPIIDRVVRATVSRRVGRVHPMITLVGALVGAAVAGVAGLILGPVALAMFVVLVDVYDKEYVGDQPLQGEVS